MNKIGIIEEKPIRYPKRAPFNPPKQYRDLPFKTETDPDNIVYPMVRDLLYRLGMDKANYGTEKWNPFKDIIKKGDKVVIKPNWVLDVSQHDINALITHMSVIRPIIDYAWKACGPKGRIDVLESPIQNTDWNNLMRVTGAQDTVDYLKRKGVKLSIQDIRGEWLVEKDIINLFGWRFKIFYRKKLKGTRRGYIDIDLEQQSALDEVRDKAHMLRGIQHWTGKKAQEAHNRKHHKYRIPKEILEANVFINVPKLKTHRKAGVTLTLKNLVGMADKKEWLPHYLEGTPVHGGDEAPTPRQLHIRLIDYFSIIHFFKKFGFSIRPPGIEKLWRRKIEEDLFELKNVRQANWYGGDTVWRMVYDLNMILFHADETGTMHKNNQRKYFSIIDGIISGERFGPLDSVPKKTGVLIGGEDPVLLEYVGTKVMGFDDKKIKTLTNLDKVRYTFGSSDFSSVEIVTNHAKWKQLLTNPKKVAFNFIPAPGWQHYIEVQK